MSAASPTLKELPEPPPGKTGWPWREQSDPLPETQPDGSPWPKISIVTPSYNQGQFIEETIRSVLLQGYPNLEYVVTDGGSDDETVEILEKYDDWINHWVSEPDEGQAHALNKGFGHCSGEIHAYINSDDFYLPGAFHEAARQFTEEKWDVFAGVSEITPHGDVDEELWYGKPEAEFNPLTLIKNFDQTLPQQATLWRSTPDVPSFDESLECVFDRKFFLELACQGASLVRSSSHIAVFRIHDACKSHRTQDTFFKENLRVNREMCKRLPEADRREAIKHLNRIEQRRRLHELSSASDLFTALRIGIEQPELLTQREFYGRLRRMVI